MPTSITSTGITFPDATTQTTAAGGGGFSNMQVFTSPGTWTKPASTNYVKSIVIGGGGGGSSPNTGGGLNPIQNGGTSSFGSFLSATGGQGGRRVPTDVPGTNGVGSFGAGGVNVSLNDRSGFGTANNNLTTNSTPTPGGNPYAAPNSIAEPAGSGGQGAGRGGVGGAALKGNIPVPGPVAVTVGASGGRGPGPSVCYAGVGGVVLVEWIQE